MKFITALAIYYMLWSHHFAETCGLLQHIASLARVVIFDDVSVNNQFSHKYRYCKHLTTIDQPGIFVTSSYTLYVYQSCGSSTKEDLYYLGVENR